MKILTIFVIFMLGGSVKSLDLHGARETQCFKIDRTVALSEEFLNSLNGPMYYPLMSRLDLYSITRDLLPQPAEEIIEGAMYYDGCIRFSVYPNGNMTSHGFNGRSRDYVTYELSSGVSRFQPAQGSGYSGMIYTTLTDNKTFAVFPFCFDNGQMSWCALSTVPKLPPATRDLIERHVKSLGFTEEYFTELRYDQCVFPPSPPQHGWSRY